MKPIKPTNADLSCCHEVQIHYKRPLFGSLVKISSAEDTEKVLRNFIDSDRIDLKEFFWVILLSNANHVLGISEIGVGCATSVLVNTKEICQLAILSHATGVIISHNHVSGALKPSEQDYTITQKLKEVLDILDITLLDHLIITSEGFVSFQEEGWM